MALLASCWLIIEAFTIPDGLVKWFYLSFYINPFFLVLCQLYLWKKYIKWFFILLLFPLKSIPYMLVSDFVKNFIFSFLYNLFFSVYNRANQEKEVFYDFDSTHHIIDDEKLEICSRFNYQITNSCYSNIIVAPPTLLFGKIDIKKYGSECDYDEEEEGGQPTLIRKNIECVPIICTSNSSKEDDMNCVFLSSPPANIYEEQRSISTQNSSDDDDDDDEMMMMNSLSSLLVSAGLIKSPVIVKREEEVDSYYNKYIERMRWYDVLNQDTTYRFSAIHNNQVQYMVSPNNSELVTANFSPQYLSSQSKMAKRNLIRSLESDFELIYVAQSCLSWELLQHQYRKIKALASSSSSQNGQFEGNVAGEFQKFRVFLNRFLEDEQCEGKRVLNYVRRRFSVKSLVQVPAISGFYEEENEYMIDQVLGAIESCIDTFWEFVKSDDHKSWWNLRPPSTVEDPRDLELLLDLTTTLRKKEIQMKELQGKARCWLRKVVNIPIEGSQGKEMLLAMVDMKLVSRVLHMPTLSSSQLKWCHQKLRNIEFRQGQVSRTCTTLFFPTS